MKTLLKKLISGLAAVSILAMSAGSAFAATQLTYKLYNYQMPAAETVEAGTVKLDVSQYALRTANEAINVKDIYLYVEGLKAADLENVVLRTPEGSILSGPGTPFYGQYLHFDDDFYIPEMGTQFFTVQVDIPEDAPLTDFRVAVRYINAESAEPPAQQVAGGGWGKESFGNYFSITEAGAEASLHVAATTTPVPQSYVSGQEEAVLGGFSFTASESSDVLVQNLTITAEADINMDGVFDDTEEAHDLINSIALFNNQGLKISEWETLDAGIEPNLATFNNLNLPVGKGTTEKFTVRADISSTLPSPTSRIKLTIADNSISAEDEAENTITEITGTPATANAMTLINSGILYTTVGPNNPTDSLIVAGKTTHVMDVSFEAQNEDFSVENFDIVITEGAESVEQVFISYPDESGEYTNFHEALVNSNGIASFHGLELGETELLIPNGDSVDMRVYLRLYPSPQAISGSNIKLRFEGDNNFKALGQDSGYFATIVPDVQSATFTVVAAEPFIEVANTNYPITEDQHSFDFTINNLEGENDMSFKRLVIDTHLQKANYPGAIGIGEFELHRGGENISDKVDITVDGKSGVDSNIYAGAAAVNKQIVITVKDSSEELIHSNSSKEYSLKFTLEASIEVSLEDSYLAMQINEDVVQPAFGIGTAEMLTGSTNVNDKILLATTAPTIAEASCEANANTVFYDVDNDGVFDDDDGDGNVEPGEDFVITECNAGANDGETTTGLAAVQFETSNAPGTATSRPYVDVNIAATDGFNPAADLQLGDSVSYDSPSTGYGGGLGPATLSMIYDGTTGHASIYWNNGMMSPKYTYNSEYDVLVADTGVAISDGASMLDTTNANFIWSDQSAEEHSSQSGDYMNGFEVEELPSNVMTWAS